MPTKEKLKIVYQKMIPQNIAERPLDIISLLNNFKSFIKQLYQKRKWTQNIKQKKDQNNCFRAEISQKEEQLLTLKEIKENDF